MLWLYDIDRVLTVELFEATSVISTRRLSEHSSWTGRFPVEALDALEAAYFAVPKGDTEIYLVEKALIAIDPETDEEYVEASGRSVTALLSTRTVDGVFVWSAAKHGAIIKDLVDSLTGARALPGLSFGTGETLGSAIDLQRSWGDMGETIREVASSGGLGLKARLSGTSILIDVYAPQDTGLLVGDAYNNGSSSRYVPKEIAEWRNFAVVLGEGEGDDRVRVDVDQTGGGERRELYVDARDIQRVVDGVTTPLADYEALLAARGAEKLADTRKIEYADATISSPREPGDVVWYDSSRWKTSLMVTEATRIIEGDDVRYEATLGEPPPTMRKMIRKAVR